MCNQLFHIFPNQPTFHEWQIGIPDLYSTVTVSFTIWLFNIAMENCPFIDGLPGFTY